MKKYVLIVLAVVLGISAISFAQDTANIRVSLLKYTPYPAESGKYVTLTLKIENTGSVDASDVRLKLTPNYPFSLDGNATVKIKNSATPVPVNSDSVVSLGNVPASEYTLAEYNLRVAQDALEGNNEIKIWYQSGSSNSNNWLIQTFNVLIQGTDRLEISLIPYIIAPGKPTDVAFIFNNSGTASLRNIIFTWSEKDNKIVPLGYGNKIYIDSIDSRESVQVPLRLVSDPGAASGAYTLVSNITYTIGSNISKSLNLNIGMFIGGAGEFDVSVQENQAGSVSLSVANVGANPATSVAVRIPQQENFNVMGSSTSFIGDLNPGDFTLVTFQISPKNKVGLATLQVEMSYTDTNGNRQTIQKEVSVNLQALAAIQGRQTGNQGQNSGSNTIIIGIIGIVVIVVLIKYNNRIRGMIKKVRK